MARCLRLAIGTLLVAGTAHADRSRVVVVSIAGDAGEAGRIGEVTGELLGRLGVASEASVVTEISPADVVTPIESPDPPLGRAWIDLRALDRATLYVADRTWARVLVRAVPRSSENDEVAREEIGHILEATVEALLAGETIGRPREEVREDLGVRPAPAAAPQPAATEPQQPPALGLGLGIFYEAQGFSQQEPLAHGPGAFVDVLAGSAPIRPALSVSAGYRFPVAADGGDVGVTLQGAVIRVMGGARIPAAPGFAFRPALGGGIDLIHVAPSQPAESEVRLEDARLTLVPLVRLEMGAELDFFGETLLRAAVATDLDLENSLYYVDRPGGRREVVFDPWTLRPSLIVGIAWDP